MLERAFRKHFTPQEANKRLPLVKKIVREILEYGQKLRSMIQKYEGQELPTEFMEMKDEMESLIAELEELGCFYKDWNFEIGLVDCPALIDDEEVSLCWRSDEDKISFYHHLAEGYAGRLPIPKNPS